MKQDAERADSEWMDYRNRVIRDAHHPLHDDGLKKDGEVMTSQDAWSDGAVSKHRHSGPTVQLNQRVQRGLELTSPARRGRGGSEEPPDRS